MSKMATTMNLRFVCRKFLQGYARVSLSAGRCARNLSQTAGSDGDRFDDTAEYDDGETEYETKLRILKASMPFVHSLGWTHNAIAKGAEVEGLPGVAHGLFPKGGVELVFYFYTDCNKRLAVHLAEQVKKDSENAPAETSGPKVRPLIRDAVETRLRMITPYIDKWPQAMAIMAIPQNTPEALSNLLNLTDEIWYHAGDTSTDFNWYTKRASLAALYKATEVYMVQDKSEDFCETWNFLDRRMEDLATVGKIARNGQETASVMTESLKGLLIMGRNILGANFRAK